MDGAGDGWGGGTGVCDTDHIALVTKLAGIAAEVCLAVGYSLTIVGETYAILQVEAVLAELACGGVAREAAGGACVGLGSEGACCITVDIVAGRTG